MQHIRLLILKAKNQSSEILSQWKIQLLKFQINDTYGNNFCESKDVIIATKKLLIVSIGYTMKIKCCLATTRCNIIDY